MTPGARRGVSIAPAALLLPVLVGAAYLDGPPPGRTGGFGEPTCAECHFDAATRDRSATVRLRGVPERWRPGAEYSLEVVLAKPGLGAGGFQLAARYARGAARGGQAGALAAVDQRVAVVDSAGVLYAHHTSGGTSPAGSDTIRWTVTWSAPGEPGPEVVFHLAANAADGDDSALGDSIVTVEKRSAGTCPDRPTDSRARTR